MSNKVILWVIVLAAVAGILILASIFRDKTPGSISQETPTLPTPAGVGTPTSDFGASVSPSLSPKPTSLPGLVAATCQITGQIVFLDKNLYENKGAKIAYQNVDDPIRQIFWKSNPDDGALTVGPNLFEDLLLPSGERNVGVAVNKDKIAAPNYILTASMTYGMKNDRGIVEERVANCVGKVLVQIPN